MPGSKMKIGLALGSGGAKGLAHIGVIKYFVENDIPIDYIAGVSAGALIGGMYAATKDIYAIERLAKKFKYTDFLRIFLDPSFSRGLVKGDKALKYLQSHIGSVNIEDLLIPFRAVATDIINAEPVIIDSGELIKAIRTSGSVPVLFKPIYHDGRYLIDGATSLPVPVRIAAEMGADVVIAVNLDSVYFSPKYRKKSLNIANILEQSVNLLRYHLAEENVKKADIVINPDIPPVRLTAFVKGDKLIAAGEKAAQETLAKFKNKLKSGRLVNPKGNRNAGS